MSAESESIRVRSSTNAKEHLFESRAVRRASNNFGTIVRALWPDKPALNLAQRIRSTERAASFYITGERKITARCVQAIINEMLS